MDPKQALAEVGELVNRINAGNAAATAAATPPGEVAQKGIQGKDDLPGQLNTERDALFENPLRKCFEILAKGSPTFGYLNSNKVLDDPQGYIRQKDANGRYLVKDRQLEQMLAGLLAIGARGAGGVPLHKFFGDQRAAGEIGIQGLVSKGYFEGQTGSYLQKALDTGSGSGGPLVRVDIDPVLREAYLRKFPAVEAIRSFPSNGKVHTFNRRTAPGTAVLVAELGDLGTASADSVGTYSQAQNSNIAVLAIRKGISLKLQYAIQQSGMGSAFDLTGMGQDNLEIVGGVTAIAKLNQTQFFQGNITDSGKTKDDEEGASTTTGFDGLRTILKGASSSITLGASQTVRDSIDDAMIAIGNAGGNLEDLMIFLSLKARKLVNNEMLNYLRLLGTEAGGFPANPSANGLVSISDMLSKFMNVPADAQTNGIGYYTKSAVVYEDIYVTDPMGMGMAYLGSPSPVVLELPVGYDSTLANVYIVFLMNGLVVDVPTFNQKIRIPKQ